MHILIIPSEEFVPASSLTTGIFQYHQANVLKSAGHKVGVISIKQSFSIPMIAKGLLFKLLRRKVGNACDHHSFSELIKLTYYKLCHQSRFLEIEQVNGIDVFRIDGFLYHPPVENGNHFGWIKAGRVAFEEYVRRHGKPDILHCHNAIYAGMLGRRLSIDYAIPYIITEHSTVFARKLVTSKKLFQRIEKAYAKSAVLTCVSKPFCRLLNEMFSINRFQCLHNVLDPNLENRTLQNFSSGNENFVFVNIAELQPKKDQATLIKAFKQVYVQNPAVRLVLGGAGELEEDLKSLAEREGLQNAIAFPGLLNRDQVFDELQKADCFVLTSKYETFGVVVIEAMLVGKPVIVTKCGGPESFVIPATGLVIEKEDESQLRDAMLQMIKERQKYKAEIIRDYALKCFGGGAFEKKVIGFYEAAVKHNGKLRNSNSKQKRRAVTYD